MATVTLSLSEPLADWIRQRLARGDYADASAYIGDLIHQDRARDQSLDQQLRRSRTSAGDQEALDFIDAAFTPE